MCFLSSGKLNHSNLFLMLDISCINLNDFWKKLPINRAKECKLVYDENIV